MKVIKTLLLLFLISNFLTTNFNLLNNVNDEYQDSYLPDVYNPSEFQTVPVSFVRISLSDKVRTSSYTPMQIELEHVEYLSQQVKVNEDKFEAERSVRLSKERELEQSKMALQAAVITEKRLKKEYYYRGLKDATHTPKLKSKPNEVFEANPTIFYFMGIVIVAIFAFYADFTLATTYPDIEIFVDMAELPWFVWLGIFVLLFFLLRYTFQLLGVIYEESERECNFTCFTNGDGDRNKR